MEIDKLLQACKSGDIEILIREIDQEDVNKTNSLGWSPLTVSCFHGNFSVAKFLLEKGADPNSCNIKGTTAVMYAKTAADRDGKYDILDLLLECGADINARDALGKSALDYVLEYKNAALEDYFRSKGALKSSEISPDHSLHAP